MNPMYFDRRDNIPYCRGCGFDCGYCAFRRLVAFNKNCPDCVSFKPHTHPEALLRKPRPTPPGTFHTIGLSSDISFLDDREISEIIRYAEKWSDRTFMIQTKNPGRLLDFIFPENMIVATTIETNETHFDSDRYRLYSDISKAPYPEERYRAMKALHDTHKVVTIEPVIRFDRRTLFNWIKAIAPDDVRIGYDSKAQRNHLPEPPLSFVRDLIEDMRSAGIVVIEKEMRRAWWEERST
jgi:DNA repair photolyase